MDIDIETPLLEESSQDDSAVMPQLRKLLTLACSDDTDEQIKAVMGISEVLRRRSVDLSSLGPLCHIVARLVASEHEAVVGYAARSLSFLVLDDALRPLVARAGIPSVLATALKRWKGEDACLREVLGPFQTLCYYEETVFSVIDAGALEDVLDLLDSKHVEVRLLSMATVINVLSFSDGSPLQREECLQAIHGRVETMLCSAKRIGHSIGSQESRYALCALANACAHPVLAERAKELGAQEFLSTLLKSQPFYTYYIVCTLARLGVPGFAQDGEDVEEEEAGGNGRSDALPFFGFKWEGYQPMRSRNRPAMRRLERCENLGVALAVVFLLGMGGVFLLFCSWAGVVAVILRRRYRRRRAAADRETDRVVARVVAMIHRRRRAAADRETDTLLSKAAKAFHC
ncbi:unnamed protein product [Ectocarpus sp. 4 AP-2014]